MNYGYDPRGVPIWLPSLLRRLRKVAGGNLVTVFHELYASGSWRQSAFWLHPVQKQIARAIARLSASCIVSNENQRAQLLGLAPEANVRVQPVPSNFGEPSFSTTDLAQRDPHRWVICGGTALVARSLNSFLQNRIVIPPSVTPHELVVVGGAESAEVRTALRKVQGIQTSYHPAIAASAASRILSTCAFGWLDYLHTPDVPMTTILKSTVFAAFCAHGIMSVFPHSGTSIHLGQDSLPGPYYISADAQSLPPLSERVSTAHLIHEWYRRNASSQQLAETIVNALGWPALTHDES
ncbi:MAG: hypothetical protein ABI540_09200 [Spartobacteria bacterium]